MTALAPPPPAPVRFAPARSAPGGAGGWRVLRVDPDGGPEVRPDDHRLDRDRRWLRALAEAFGHEPALLVAVDGEDRVGAHLPLCLTRSALFGRFASSLPYVNTGGVAGDADAAGPLVDAAVDLAAGHDAKWLELRHETPVGHRSITHELTHKVHMRLPLPDEPGGVLAGLKSKRRSQVNKALRGPATFRWGRQELLDDFHRVFAENMRDLGTPAFGRELFAAILRAFGDRAEFCVGYDGGDPVAAALLVHHPGGRTEVPSASTLRRANPAGVNMALYHHLLTRAVERGSDEFDFGRSTAGGSTYRFKTQWGAEPHPACWQFAAYRGTPGGLSPDAGGFSLAVKAWRRLPLAVANRLGPRVVRGLP